MNQIAKLVEDRFVGIRLRLTKDIYDDGADNHHPPGYCALRGDIVVVRRVGEKSLGVSHEGITDNSFTVYLGEFEILDEKQTTEKEGEG